MHWHSNKTDTMDQRSSDFTLKTGLLKAWQNHVANWNKTILGMKTSHRRPPELLVYKTQLKNER